MLSGVSDVTVVGFGTKAGSDTTRTKLISSSVYSSYYEYSKKAIFAMLLI